MDEPELLRYDQGVVDDHEIGVTKSPAHLGRVPELLMAGPPFRDRSESFAFAQRVVQVHIGQAHHPHRGGLDNRDRAALLPPTFYKCFRIVALVVVLGLVVAVRFPSYSLGTRDVRLADVFRILKQGLDFFLYNASVFGR